MPLTPTDIVSAPLLHAGHPVPSRDRIVNGLLFIPLYQYRDSNRITLDTNGYIYFWWIMVVKTVLRL